MKFSERLRIAVSFVLSTFLSSEACSAQEEWDLVYIGQSYLPQAIRLYGETIEAKHGVSVKFWQRNSTLIQFAIRSLQDGSWDIVTDAEIVVVNFSQTFGRREGACLESSAEFLYPETPEKVRGDVDEFIEELSRHVDFSETIVRIAITPIHPRIKGIWVERGILADCARGWNNLVDQWREAALDNGLLVFDAMLAWNGPDGTKDAPSAYYSGTVHILLSAEGNAELADLIYATGLSPLLEEP